MNIINIPLKDKKWIRTQTKKTHIVWHGSYGRTKYSNGKATDTIIRWNNLAEKYGAPYLIDRDGTIYKTFDDEEWIYHLNIPTSRGVYDKQSIAIALANEQQLIKENGRYFAFEYEQTSNLYTGQVFENHWRRFKWYAKLDDQQVDAAIEITIDAAQRHNIEPVFYVGNEWNPDVWNKATIFTHAVTKREVNDLFIEPWVVDKIKAAGITVVDS
ncbi:N-acetylmuramoyl-L-alanine amidase [Acinetobacter sp.]|uniref:N-acetylmuramoyl-L-alanine amidase n=1 Tax=Acinetobacter sp. TaxID=472 RepID=UPI0037525AC4